VCICHPKLHEEAEWRRIMVPDQLGQKRFISIEKSWIWWYRPVISVIVGSLK
jgi:hypothetical protein